MNTGMIWQIISTGSADTERLGQLLGEALAPPALIELVSDLGGGKTTFVRGLGAGLGIKNNITSPTFTLSRIYEADDTELHHFDFYRLNEAGVIADQLSESLGNDKAITVVEWSDVVKDVLPEERLTLELKMTANNPDEREITLRYPAKFTEVVKKVQLGWEEVRP